MKFFEPVPDLFLLILLFLNNGQFNIKGEESTRE